MIPNSAMRGASYIHGGCAMASIVDTKASNIPRSSAYLRRVPTHLLRRLYHRTAGDYQSGNMFSFAKKTPRQKPRNFVFDDRITWSS